MRRFLTLLAALLVLVALVAPPEPSPGAFLRVPVEGLVGVALLLLLPARTRRGAATAAGIVLGGLTVLWLLDAGYTAVFARPFDPLVDAGSLGAGVEFLAGSIGEVGATAVVVGAVALAVAVLVALVWAVRRLAGVLDRHRSAAARGVAALAGVCVVATLLGAPVASAGTAALVRDHAAAVRDGLADRDAFAAELAVDPHGDVPAAELLTALRGRDVVVAFVESYGRTALADPAVSAVLDDGTRVLDAAGYGARSAYLTSPVAGGGSWLAHATFLSGLRIDTQARHDALMASDRRTLTSAFGDAGWRTVGVMPGTTREWPEAAFYGYDRVHGFADLGYRGPDLGWATVPDQYTLAAFERLEHAAPGPLMAELALVSGHTPWPFVPPVLGWDEVGDGAVYGALAADPATRPTGDPRADYGRATAYSLASLVSWVRASGDDDLVLLLLGDHQPLSAVTGADAGRDVPVTVVTRDAGVLDGFAGWGWEAGMRPGPAAPVAPMEGFRDRFLETFTH